VSSRDVSRFIDVVETRARAEMSSVSNAVAMMTSVARVSTTPRASRTVSERVDVEKARRGTRSIARALDCGEIACTVDPNAGESMVARINDVTVSARALREVEVVDADGARETIGNIAGDASPVVLVVLRHLG
tara:strand:- start:28215 stop:28613 length:399 start_codon:yes stop_codon:yes gene_type:complete